MLLQRSDQRAVDQTDQREAPKPDVESSQQKQERRGKRRPLQDQSRHTQVLGDPEDSVTRRPTPCRPWITKRVGELRHEGDCRQEERRGDHRRQTRFLILATPGSTQRPGYHQTPGDDLADPRRAEQGGKPELGAEQGLGPPVDENHRAEAEASDEGPAVAGGQRTRQRDAATDVHRHRRNQEGGHQEPAEASRAICSPSP